MAVFFIAFQQLSDYIFKSIMKRFSFYKYSGAGNDFILIDEKENPGFRINVDLVRKICSRRTSIGADGVLFFYECEGHDYSLDYYNADGSTGMLCANGARCSVLHAKKNGAIKDNHANFISNGKIYSGEVIEEGIVKLNLNSPSGLNQNIIIEVDDMTLTGDFIDTGSPFFVIDLDAQDNSLFVEKYEKVLAKVNVEYLGSKIRNHKKFAPMGVNVDFIQVNRELVRVRTFERGVEAETLASGTGSVAAGIIAGLKYNLNPPINIVTGGGIDMMVNYVRDEKVFSNVSLTGPVELVFTGVFFI